MAKWGADFFISAPLAFWQLTQRRLTGRTSRVLSQSYQISDKMVNTYLSCEYFAGRWWRREMYGLRF